MTGSFERALRVLVTARTGVTVPADAPVEVEATDLGVTVIAGAGVADYNDIDAFLTVLAAATRVEVVDTLAGHLPERHVITEQVFGCSCGRDIDSRCRLSGEQAERAWALHVAAEVTR